MIPSVLILLAMILGAVGIVAFVAYVPPPKRLAKKTTPDEDDEPYLDPETEHMIWLVSDMEYLAAKVRDGCPEGCDVEIPEGIPRTRYLIAHYIAEHQKEDESDD